MRGAANAIRRQQAEQGPERLRWHERLLVVRSEAFAAAARRGFQHRLHKAQAALTGLTPAPGRGRRQFTDEALLREAVQDILRRYEVEGMLIVQLKREIRRRAVRAYRDRPARVDESQRYVVHVRPNTAAIERHERTLGWRVYATNAPRRALPFARRCRLTAMSG